MTPPPLRPAEWPRTLAYEIEDRGGHPFLGGRMIVGKDVRPSRPLPLELLPEIAAVDTDSDAEILDFAQTHGVLGAWPDRFALMRSPESPFPSRRKREIARVVKTRKAHAMWGTDRDGEFLDEFRIAAGGLASLVAIIRELERSRFSAARLGREWPSYSPWTPPTTKLGARHDLLDRLSHGLQGVRTALWLITDEAATAYSPWTSSDDLERTEGFLVHPAPPNNLYGVCIFELVDHISADAPYRICANETCRHLFSVQEGRSRYGGHRTENVKFHTAACKAAQAAREYRRRQRKGKTR